MDAPHSWALNKSMRGPRRTVWERQRRTCGSSGDGGLIKRVHGYVLLVEHISSKR